MLMVDILTPGHFPLVNIILIPQDRSSSSNTLRFPTPNYVTRAGANPRAVR